MESTFQYRTINQPLVFAPNGLVEAAPVKKTVLFEKDILGINVNDMEDQSGMVSTWTQYDCN